jgi:hypothetical protein
MARDIKELLQNHEPESIKIPQGHEVRFEERLKANFSEKNAEEKSSSIHFLKIAAMVVVLLAVSFFGYQELSKNNPNNTHNLNNTVVDANSENPKEGDSPQLTLADISPDLKKVQEFYMTGINMQLASLKITDENKELVDGYMERLAELDKEYTVLNTELTKVGPTEATVTALIDNLRLRLDLLFKLKSKLKELKNQDNDEFKTIQS